MEKDKKNNKNNKNNKKIITKKLIDIQIFQKKEIQ